MKDLAVYYKIPELDPHQEVPGASGHGWAGALYGLGYGGGARPRVRRGLGAAKSVVVGAFWIAVKAAGLLLRAAKVYFGIALFIAAGLASVASVVLTMTRGRSGGASFAAMAVILWFVAAPVLLVKMLAEQAYAHERVGPVVDAVHGWCVAAWTSVAEAASYLAGFLFG
jgi:hypothetical protein